ncbi:DUF2326 domain-containing protein [Herbaspirillum sp. 1130]|uniref:DUF2326 domain-containing protein n=1 Tax=Herbaspirillum sp. 1130 TaxID=2806562 RepID=UPI001AE373CE|nr:DUF2326 domain-containing protein [Herbaspirillum sp. 1130]MBP1315269.1 uncharacterized protein YydD (DUF2326 family) [Herbaspirillum sp. 1130]
MRLIKISANQNSFKTVRFNKTGLSLIVGVRTDVPTGEDSKDDRSYNGVGKSLLVEILHFCLGSSTNKAFQQHLIDWVFTVEFEANGQSHVISRETGKQSQPLFNGKPYKVSALNQQLEKFSFVIPDIADPSLSFRALIPRFIRRNVHDYNDPKVTSGDREPYTVLLRNLFLLDLDIDLVTKKYQLRRRQVEIEEFEKNFKNDPFIREYYTGNKDASLQTKYLEEQINRLDADLSKFKVAEDFYAIEREANDLNKRLRELKNKRVIAETALRNVEKSLQMRSDISKEKIIALYSELMAAFRSETLQRLDDVQEFHKQLVENRIARFGQERMRLNAELQILTQQIAELNLQVDEKLAYLSDKRALDQYVAVSSQRSELLGRLHKLQDYQRLLQKSREELIHIRKDLNEETIKTTVYLLESTGERERNISLFSSLAKLFYPEAPAGITLDVNDGENKIRYDFDVRIEADGSDGINAVKIFCYDLAVLLLNGNHRMDFIWHDSRLYSDIDPRQRAVLFKVAHEYTARHGKQYIATVNQDQIDAMEQFLAPDEFEKLFGDDKRVLTLKDDGDASKLLGIQVDMHYN